MSVIVAVKEGGVVYMGADTQTSVGKRKINNLNEMGYKIACMDNGILVGFCGRVAVKQKILSMRDVFTLDSEGKLTKKHIVTEIVPKLVAQMEELGDEESGALDVSILLAHKNDLYKITPELDVIKHVQYAVSGAGEMSAQYALLATKGSARKKILKGLVESAKRTESVAGPFILIDTRKARETLEKGKNIESAYEVVDMGEDNG